MQGKSINRPLYLNLVIDEILIKEKVEYRGGECCGYVDISIVQISIVMTYLQHDIRFDDNLYK